MSGRDFAGLHAAYSAAWATRVSSGDDSVQVLDAELSRAGWDDPFIEPGPARDVVVGLWERGVPPERFKRELQRSTLCVLPSALREWGASMREVVGVLRENGLKQVDRSWLDMPAGHRTLSKSWRTQDLALRWFHPRADSVPLPMRLDGTATSLLQRCMGEPSANRDLWAEVPVWLRLADERPQAEVMVGRERIGWTEVPDAVWTSLRDLERRRVFADGTLMLERAPTIDTTELHCFLPRAS